MIDSGATSTCVRPQGGCIKTSQKSNKVFKVATGEQVRATEKAFIPMSQLNIKVRGAEVVPEIKENALIRVAKLAYAGYVTVLDGKGVEVYEHKRFKVQVYEKAILRGWIDNIPILWRVPIKEKVVNKNTETLLLDRPDPVHGKNVYYELPSSTEKTIKYLHEAAGFPTKKTWIKAIKAEY